MRTLHVSVILGAYLCCALLVAQSTEKVDFERDVQPILREHCFRVVMGLHNRCEVCVLTSGASQSPIEWGERSKHHTGEQRGKPALSQIDDSATGSSDAPSRSSERGVVNTMRNWIDEGADWPDALAGRSASSCSGSAGHPHDGSSAKRGAGQKFSPSYCESIRKP